MAALRTARLTLELLGRRDPPSHAAAPPVGPPQSTAQLQTTASSASRSIQVQDLIVAQGGKRHYSHVRVAMLAYAGTPIGTQPFATFAPTDTLLTVPDADGEGEHYERVSPDPARSGLTEEQFDAVLVLAASAELPFGEPPPLE